MRVSKRHRDAPTDLANTYKTDSYITADASLRYKHDGFSANLTVKNLTDERYYVPFQYLTGGVAAAPGRASI